MKRNRRVSTLFAVVLCNVAFVGAGNGESDVLIPSLGAEHGFLFGPVGANPERPGSEATDLGNVASSTEIGHGNDENTVSMKSRYESGRIFAVDTSYIQKGFVDRQYDASAGGTSFWEMKMNSALGAGLPALEGRFAVSSFDPYTSDGFGDSSTRSYRIGTKGTFGDFGYGVNYFSVGKEFERFKIKGEKEVKKPKTDREGNEAWVYRKFGKTGIRTFLTRYHDNVEDDPNRAHFTDSKVGTSVDYTILSWPYLGYSATYSTGTRTSSDEPAGYDSYREPVESMRSALNYSSNQWSGSVSVDYSKTGSFSGPVNVLTYYVGGFYYPSGGLSVTPSVSWVEENYSGLGVRTLTQSADMTVAYHPPNSKLKFSAYGGYSASENRDWGTDTEYLYSALGVDWPTRKTAPDSSRWVVQLTYDSYIDNIYSSANTGDTTLWLKFRGSLASWLPR